MSNQTSSGHDTSKDRQRTKSNSPKSIDTGIKERFSFEDLDGVRREDLHARSASEPLIDEQVMQRTLHPTTNQVRRKPVLSVDSVNPAVQGYGEVAQRSTASLPDTSRPRQPMSTSSGSNSPARSPAFKRFFNTYQQSRMPKKNIQQDREGSSSREGPTLSPLTPIAASVHDSLRRTNSVLDQVMDNENVASRSSGTRQPPLQPVMPRRSADNQGVMFSIRSRLSTNKDLPGLPSPSNRPPLPPTTNAGKRPVQLDPANKQPLPDKEDTLTHEEIPTYIALRRAYTLAEMAWWAADQLTDMALPDSRVPEEFRPLLESHICAKISDFNLCVGEVQKGIANHRLYDRARVGHWNIVERAFADVLSAANVLEKSMTDSAAVLRGKIAERELK